MDEQKKQKPSIKVSDDTRKEIFDMRQSRDDRRGGIETAEDVITRLIADAKARGRLIGKGSIEKNS